MKKLYIILNSKGGVGKSTIAKNLCVVAAYRGLNFEYIEIDDSNNTPKKLVNSKTFANRMTSCKVSKAQEELFKATFKARKEDKICFIDLGGGNDTVTTVSLISAEFSHHDIGFILPFENDPFQMENLEDTYNYINNPDNTFLVKNKVLDLKNEKDPFIFFEGDKVLGVESYRTKIKPKNKVFEIYFNPNISLAGITKECMLDLADLALQYPRQEAEEIFMAEAENMNEYNELMQKYSKSDVSLKEIKRLSEEFKELFDESESN